MCCVSDCLNNDFYCQKSNICIHRNLTCDYYSHCQGGEDEDDVLCGKIIKITLLILMHVRRNWYRNIWTRTFMIFPSWISLFDTSKLVSTKSEEKYKERNNHPTSVNLKSLVHIKHNKARNKCHTKDNTDTHDHSRAPEFLWDPHLVPKQSV